jgi:hypothetical protein
MGPNGNDAAAAQDTAAARSVVLIVKDRNPSVADKVRIVLYDKRVRRVPLNRHRVRIEDEHEVEALD